MKANEHITFQHMIDESLAGSLPAGNERSLRDHLDMCASCREYLSASNRVIAGLGGFSFEVDPGLNARVFASLRAHAQPAPATQRIQAPQPTRRPWMPISLAAAVLTLVGSSVDLQLGRLIVPFFDISPAQLQHGLLAFWIVPSLGVFLLFPLLPLLSKAATRREERIL